MKNNNVKIWIWMQNGKLLKAVSRPDDGVLTIYDDQDNILIKRTKLTPAQLKKIEMVIESLGAKRMDGNSRPYTYL